MKTKTKIWLVIAVLLVLIGGVLFARVMSALDWDFTKLTTAEYEITTHEMSEAFDRIAVDTDTADVVFAVSEDGKCKVECYEETKAKHTVLVQDGALTVAVAEKRTAFDFIGITFDTPKITVYLPKTAYTSLVIEESTGDITVPAGFAFDEVGISLSTGDVFFSGSVTETLKIKTSTGDIRVEETAATTLDLAVSTGETYLSDVFCVNLVADGDTGSITLKNFVAAEKMSVVRSTGDVVFDGADAGEISVETDTGRVCGSLLSAKTFDVHTDTGRVDVPATEGGRCVIKTDTGDIFVTVQ